jgi:hypothetical protein
LIIWEIVSTGSLKVGTAKPGRGEVQTRLTQTILLGRWIV